MRVGFGYDVHAFCKNRRLILGGVDIPFEYGLAGHSDADVLMHAIIDAIFGAACLGTIGEHFPDTDPEYKDIDSLILLKKTNDLLGKNGFSIENIDSTIVAQRPKLLQYLTEMRNNIATVLNIAINSVSIKAKCEEGLGFTGRLEGIKAYAVVLIK